MDLRLNERKLKLLLLNYYWPPCGGPAVQRWLDFAKRFAHEGHELVVVTVDPKYATYTAIDDSLLAEVPKEVRVIHTKCGNSFDIYKKYIGKGKVPGNALADEPYPTLLQKIARWVRGNLLLPDPRRNWNKYAYTAALECIRSQEFDIFITAGPPHSTHLIGLELKKYFPNKIWIADFHDYWTDVFYLKKFYRTSIAQWFDKRLEYNVLISANAILCDTTIAKNLYENKLNKIKKPIKVVRIGYDEKKLAHYDNPVHTKDFYQICYTGTLPDYYDSEVIFKALCELIKKNPEFKIKFVLAGIISPVIEKMAKQYNLDKIVEIRPYMKHSAVIELLRESNMYFMINPKVDGDEGIVPGKLYEYIAFDKPILCISSHGSENEMILDRHQIGKNFEREESEEILKYIHTEYSHWAKGNSIRSTQGDLSQYSRENIYQDLKKFIIELIEKKNV